MPKPVDNADWTQPLLSERMSKASQQLIEQQTVLPDLAELVTTERDAEIWRLTTLGWAGWRIVRAMGLADIKDVSAALTRYLESSELDDEQKRAVMVGQLDEAIRRTMEILGHVHYKVYKGSLIMVPEDPMDPRSIADIKAYVPLIDDGPRLDAAKTLAVLLDRKAKLLGLDAPEKHEHTLIPLPVVAQDWVAAKRAQVIEGTAN